MGCRELAVSLGPISAAVDYPADPLGLDADEHPLLGGETGFVAFRRRPIRRCPHGTVNRDVPRHDVLLDDGRGAFDGDESERRAFIEDGYGTTRVSLQRLRLQAVGRRAED